MREFLLASSLLLSTVSFAEISDEKFAPKDHKIDDDEISDTYTINFNNVSVVEYIRFVSKISKMNFVFQEADLPFTVTVVSEEPVTAKNVMSILVQILRVHDLNLLEQEGNLLITKSKEVHQIPAIVSPDLKKSRPHHAPIITRVFRIKNASLGTVISIIRPLMSSTAQIESSPETKQLIITDITTNIEKISSLLVSIDSPHSPLEVENFTAKNVSLSDLIELTTEIVKPFAESNPLIFVPQPENNTIYIISTPYLIERAITVLEDLDIPSQGGKQALGQKTGFYIYKIERANEDQIEKSLKQMANNLEKSKFPDQALVNALNSMRWIKESNSLIFTGSEASLKQLEQLVPSFDVPPENAKTNSKFFIYHPTHLPGKEIRESILEIHKNLEKSELADPAFLSALESVRWVPSTNSLIFTGDAASIAKIQDIIQSMDNTTAGVGGGVSGKTSFFIYKPEHRSAKELFGALKTTADDLEASGLIDPALLLTINSMRLVESTHSILFTGSSDSIAKVKELLAKLDIVSEEGAIEELGALTFFVYKLQYVSSTQLMAALRNFSLELQKSATVDKSLVNAIESMKWVKETNSILFTGPAKTLQKIETLVQKFDIPALAQPGQQTRGATAFVIYKPKYQAGTELMNILCDFEQNLVSSGVTDQGLFDTINNLKWIEKTSSLLISGDEPSIKKVEDLLVKFDVPTKGSGGPAIDTIENTSFLVYKLQYHQGTAIQTALKQISEDLAMNGTGTNQALMSAINSLQWIQVTNSLLGTGEQEVLTKLKELIQNLDVPLKQVFIEVLVIQTTLKNSQAFGLQWGGRLQYFNRFTSTTGNFPGTNAAGTNQNQILTPLNNLSTTVLPGQGGNNVPFPTQGFDFGVIGDLVMHKGKSFLSLGSLINALQIDQDSTILLNPKIIAQDNNLSTVFFGQNVPYTASVVTNNTTGGSTIQTSSLEYINVGNSLSITPLIGNSDVITLDIENNISEITTNVNAGGNGILQGIQTNQTTMQTRVHVPDKHFVILTGQISDTKTHYKSSIPCLGGLPVIGLAFSDNERLNSKNNIVIFLRPHIIHSYDEYRDLTNHQECVYKDQAVLHVLKDEFDDAIDIVKTSEDE
jgi:type II secretory pathway component GspD/PulD (secretin)